MTILRWGRILKIKHNNTKLRNPSIAAAAATSALHFHFTLACWLIRELVWWHTHIGWTKKPIFHHHFISFLPHTHTHTKPFQSFIKGKKRKKKYCALLMLASLLLGFRGGGRRMRGEAYSTCWRTLAFFTGWWSGKSPKWMCGKWAHCRETKKTGLHRNQKPTKVSRKNWILVVVVVVVVFLIFSGGGGKLSWAEETLDF